MGQNDDVTGRQRKRRRLGAALSAAGALLVAYAALVAVRGDPATAVYARWQQERLSSQLEAALPSAGRDLARSKEEALVRKAAAAFSDELRSGDPLGRIVVPTLGLDLVFVHGTRWAEDLSRGPGHYVESSLPGLGGVTAIAGHRTTFGAPFRRIDRLEPGDEITLELPYGRFEYRVFAHEIVEDDDWTILDERDFEVVVLSACHPLYSTSHRWVVYARLSNVAAGGGIVRS